MPRAALTQLQGSPWRPSTSSPILRRIWTRRGRPDDEAAARGRRFAASSSTAGSPASAQHAARGDQPTSERCRRRGLIPSLGRNGLLVPALERDCDSADACWSPSGWTAPAEAGDLDGDRHAVGAGDATRHSRKAAAPIWPKPSRGSSRHHIARPSRRARCRPKSPCRHAWSAVAAIYLARMRTLAAHPGKLHGGRLERIAPWAVQIGRDTRAGAGAAHPHPQPGARRGASVAASPA